MSASFKGFHKAANFIHKSPKFAVSLLKLIKMWYSPLLLSIFTWGNNAPQPAHSYRVGDSCILFHGNQRKTNQ